MAKIGIFGAGWVGLVTGVCFAELGHEVVIRDVVPGKIESLGRGEVPFHERDVPELLERNRERLSFTLDANDVVDCELLFVCVDTPPTYSGDADLSRVWTRRRGAARARRTAGAGDEVDRAGRHRREGSRRARRARARARRLRLEPRVPLRRKRGQGLHAPGSHRRRRVRAGRRRCGGGAVRAARRADRPLRRELRRDDQARRERVPDDPHLVHQRDRERLRGDGRRRRRRWRRASASTTGSARTSCAPGSATAARASRRTRWR